MNRRVVTVAVGAALLLAGCSARPSAPPTVPEPASSPAPTAGRSAAASRTGELTSGPLMASSPPVTVSIPRLGVTSDLIDLATEPDGTMQVPDDASTVGWFTGAPTPGALGPAVLAGHVDWKGTKGAFYHLATLAPGDEVSVTRLDGSRAVFAVHKVGRYPKDAFPTQDVYGPVDHAALRLITCGGEFDAATGHYRDNIVAFADLEQAQPGPAPQPSWPATTPHR
ncbi:class F sortase [Dactylosporangium sp. NPDC051541]|uniref:class F sortase n=1 Tax=Dactylosporangium sp. NPDC051541 TaxID=3363977 RepID=UPI0037A1E31C